MEPILHHLLYDIGVTPQHLPAEEQAPPPGDLTAPAPADGNRADCRCYLRISLGIILSE
jgi:hypothetical protein